MPDTDILGRYSEFFNISRQFFTLHEFTENKSDPYLPILEIT
jgi:hypothetical protein